MGGTELPDHHERRCFMAQLSDRSKVMMRLTENEDCV